MPKFFDLGKKEVLCGAWQHVESAIRAFRVNKALESLLRALSSPNGKFLCFIKEEKSVLQEYTLINLLKKPKEALIK